MNDKWTEAFHINIPSLINLAVDSFVGYIPKIIGAILILWIGFKIANMIQRALQRLMDIKDWDEMLEGFIVNLSAGLLKVAVFISAIGVLGVETSSIIAMLAAAGFAIGMALSGTLQNFAGGIMILVLRPFKIGHYVEIAGYSGTVKEIHIFNSLLLTPDKKKIILPNSDIINSPIINFSSETKRRVDHVIGISYGDDVDKAKKILLEIAQSDERILDQEEMTIGIGSFGDNSVNIDFRFFVKRADYWDVYRDSLEAVKKAFDKKGVSFPFPQRDVHLFQEK